MVNNAPLLLVIRDGYGINRRKEGNAVKLANTPNTDRIMKDHPYTILCPAGECVGLPKGYQGNSEVGHLNMGAGRVIYQMLVVINKDIESGEFFKNKALISGFEYAKTHGTSVHLMGLVQDQGVHSHQDHLFALLKMAAAQKAGNVYIHFFSDGRDTPPRSAMAYLEPLKKEIARHKTGRIATVIGRYYAMDRDKRWERTELAYRGIAFGEGRKAASADEAIKSAYALGEGDEFIKPCIIGDYPGLKEDDVIIFFNYRFDRPRQLTQALAESSFSGFKASHPKIKMVTMTNYYNPMNAESAYKEIKIDNNLGRWLSVHGLKQLRISETEKYAHVTFFFNSEEEKPYPGEDRLLVPSPKVATYDLKPDMSAYEVTDLLLKKIDEDKYDFILLNLVNGDMVGHTGKLDACIRAVEVIDDCVGRLYTKIMEKKGTMMITADHGNCEMKIDYRTGEPLTSHTTNPVYLIIASANPALKDIRLKQDGVLGNIAPTVLDIFGLKRPAEMTSESLISHEK